MKPAECRGGVVVRDSETGAVGVILRGGYRPRVRWSLNGRTLRVEEDRLRFVAEDETAYRRMCVALGHPPGTTLQLLATVTGRMRPDGSIDRHVWNAGESLDSDPSNP